MSESETEIEGQLVIAIKQDDGSYRHIDPRLGGIWKILDAEFVVPFLDDMTAEEIGRLVTGMVRRAE